MNPKAGTLIITNQMIELLSKVDNVRFVESLTTFNGSSIGQHVRHIIDFYLCLIKGCNETVIDYDKRMRNPLIEKDTKVAVEELKEISLMVQNLDIRQIVQVNSSFSDDENEDNSQIPSSVGRELMYAYDHAIHHLAMVKIGMGIHFPEIKISPNLGVAPSTLKYRKGQKVAS
ncbi:MAG: hypothetical protein ACPG19_11960 [Saprospiraceae bacterium]